MKHKTVVDKFSTRCCEKKVHINEDVLIVQTRVDGIVDNLSTLFFRVYIHLISPHVTRSVMAAKVAIGIPVKQRQIEQKFVLRCIGMSWMGFRLAQLPTP